MKTAHTPTPWRGTSTRELGNIIVTANDKSNGLYIAQVRQHGVPNYGSSEANTEFIVRAVNNHDALVEALERAFHVMPGDTERQREVLAEIGAALAAARGEEVK